VAPTQLRHSGAFSKRDSINQAIGYAVSYRCKRIVLAHPRAYDQAFAGLRVLGRVADIELRQYIFDLAAPDLAMAEDDFGRAIGSLATIAGTPANHCA
jgi:hypothetical protein